jgi:hypothetical protein
VYQISLNENFFCINEPQNDLNDLNDFEEEQNENENEFDYDFSLTEPLSYAPF